MSGGRRRAELPFGGARAAWAARGLAAVVLVVGLVALAVRWLPPTTWAVPVAPGDHLGAWTVVEVRRTPTEARVSLRADDDRRAVVRLVDRRNGVHAAERVTRRVRVVAESGADDGVLDAVAAPVAAWEARWPRPPRFVAAAGVVEAPRHAAETATLHVVVLVGLVAWTAALPRVLALVGGGWGALAVASAVVALQAALVLGLGVPGVWHSNLHGLDRIADVERLTPPGAAALGRLHGHGYYVVLQPLYALAEGHVGVFGLALGVASVALVALFGWIRVGWGGTREAGLGVLWLATFPPWLKIAGSEDMYVPAVAALALALLAFEGFLKRDDARWLALAAPPALLAMHTRAELLVLVPLALGLAWGLRRPATLVRAWRRPAIVGIVVLAGLACVPRALGILADPPPAELQRAASDPLRDPRLVVLGLLGLAGLASTRAGRVVVAAVGRGRVVAVVVIAVGAYLGWLVGVGGPEERTWQLHPGVDPRLAAPWALVPCLFALPRMVRLTPARLAWVLLVGAVTTWVYLPQLDCLSTFVRTGATVLPLLAMLAGVGAARVPGAAAWGLAVLLGAGGVAWATPWLVSRSPKQLTGDLVAAARSTLPPGAVVVAPGPEDLADLPAEARAPRLRVQHVLGPDVRVVSIAAWSRGEVQGPAWFLRTADCHHVALARDGTAWLGDVRGAWRYLDSSTLDTGARVALAGFDDVEVDPACARVLAQAEPVVTWRLPTWNDGSVAETLVGLDPAIGLYRLVGSPGVSGVDARPAPGHDGEHVEAR